MPPLRPLPISKQEFETEDVSRRRCWLSKGAFHAEYDSNGDEDGGDNNYVFTAMLVVMAMTVMT